MPVEAKKSRSRAAIKVRMGNRWVTVNPMSLDEVQQANARIQRQIQPVIVKLKRTRRAASITASQIILNA
jgi:hypothetical protein